MKETISYQCHHVLFSFINLYSYTETPFSINIKSTDDCIHCWVIKNAEYTMFDCPCTYILTALARFLKLVISYLWNVWQERKPWTENKNLKGWYQFIKDWICIFISFIFLQKTKAHIPAKWNIHCHILQTNFAFILDYKILVICDMCEMVFNRI